MTISIIRRLDQAESTRRSDEVVQLYGEVYAEPPYNEGPEQQAAYMDRFRSESASPGFELVVAEDAGKIIGFVYGLTLANDQWWPEALTPEPAFTQGQPKYMVCEFAVKSEHRGRGIGGDLLSSLLSVRTEPWATLCSNPAAPARQIYQRWGWEKVGTADFHGLPPMDILVRNIVGSERNTPRHPWPDASCADESGTGRGVPGPGRSGCCMR